MAFVTHSRRIKLVNSSRASLGFTLVEVLIALLILATSMIVILSLQGSIMSRTVQDGRAQRAYLASRLILSLIESQEDTLALVNEQGSADNIIRAVAPQGENLPALINLADYADLHASISTELWNTSGITPNSLKKFVVRLQWGAGPGDFIETIYLATEELKSEEAE